MRIHLERPGLFIAARGADQDPSPPVRGVRSLKGAKAGRIVRAFCDWRPAVGIRDLAGRAEADPGYTSRVVKLLEEEDLLNWDNDGRILSVDWRGLLRRWSRDYDVAKSNRAVPFLSPRGLQAFTDRLRSNGTQHALTGSLAVPPAASVAPERLASCCVDDPETTAERLDLFSRGRREYPAARTIRLRGLRTHAGGSRSHTRLGDAVCRRPHDRNRKRAGRGQVTDFVDGGQRRGVACLILCTLPLGGCCSMRSRLSWSTDLRPYLWGLRPFTLCR